MSPAPRGRDRIFTVAAVVAVPLIVLSGLEAGLRVGGFGFDPSFFVEREIEGKRVLTDNPRFGWRFFPKAVARGPQRFSVSREKAPGTVRVCVLGGSAAMGDPDPARGIPRVVEAMLEECRPDLRFEIVNAAMTAINSHVVLPIARDCLANGADLLVVYLGHNEVVGPFGVGSVFGRPGAPIAVSRAIIRLRATRVGQLLDELIGAVVGRAREPEAWTGMELFLGTALPLDDPRVAVVHANFRRNLADLCDAAIGRDVPVVVASVGVNLRDCAPFASRHRDSLSEEEKARWERLVAAGIAMESAADLGGAASAFGAAAAIDDRHAELVFRLTRVAHELGDAAGPGFAAARDLDVLRFRADHGIQAAIRQVATERKGDVRFVDAMGDLRASSSGSVPGAEFFDDHVHLNFEGNWVVGRALVKGILPLLPGSGEEGPIPGRERCAERLGFTPRARHATLEMMRRRRQRPPLSYQIDAGEWERRLEDDIAERESFTQPHHLRKSIVSLRERLSAHPHDWHLQEELADLLARTGDLGAALVERQDVLRRFPYSPDAHYAVGTILRRMGRGEEAMQAFRTTVDLFPGHFLAHAQLGEELVNADEREEAIRHFREAIRRYPDAATTHRSLGDALLELDRPQEAIPHLARAVEINPELAAAHKRMGDALVRLGREQEAVHAYRQALRINPRYEAARSRLTRLEGDPTP
jgi:tetratricopeptide (TPR) repeat protein